MKHISYSIDNYVPTKEVSLNILDNFLTVVRGYQVFTVLKTVNKGRPIFLNYHLDRVLDNAQSMNMIVRQSKEEIKSLVQDTLNQNKLIEISTGNDKIDYLIKSVVKDNLITEAEELFLKNKAKEFSFEDDIIDKAKQLLEQNNPYLDNIIHIIFRFFLLPLFVISSSNIPSSSSYNKPSDLLLVLLLKLFHVI